MKSELVLIIEDNPAVARRLKKGLEDVGNSDVFTAETVCEFDIDAVTRAINSYKPAVIILDIIDDKSEEPKGHSFVSEIRCMPGELGKTPIIMKTRQNTEPFKAAVEGIRAGAKDIIFQEDGIESVINRIREAIDARKAANEQQLHYEQQRMEAERYKKRKKPTIISIIIAGILSAIQIILNFLAVSKEFLIIETSVMVSFALLSCAIIALIIAGVINRK